jgi:hypothetical protein
MRFVSGHLVCVLAGVVLLTMARPAAGRGPVLVVRPYYAPYPPVVIFGYRPRAAVVVPVVPRMYDFRGLDPVWAGVYSGTYGGAYRMTPPETWGPAQALPASPSVPEVIPTPGPAPEASGSGPRAF